MSDQSQAPGSLFSTRSIRERLEDLRLTEDVTELRREVLALVEVAEAAEAEIRYGTAMRRCPTGRPEVYADLRERWTNARDLLDDALSRFDWRTG